MTYNELLVSTRHKVQTLLNECQLENDLQQSLVETLAHVEQAIRLGNPVETICEHFGCSSEHFQKNARVEGKELWLLAAEPCRMVTFDELESALRGYHLCCKSLLNNDVILEPNDWIRRSIISVDDDGWWVSCDLKTYLHMLRLLA